MPLTLSSRRPPPVSPRSRRPLRVTTTTTPIRTARKRTEISKEDLRRQKSSPLVRRIAKEHNVDIKLIKGTGISGRVTKQDILGFIQSGAGPTPAAGSAARRAAALPAYAPGESVKVVPMSVMRRKIAEHMVLSAHTSPHVYSVYEINFGRVASLREARKADYEAAGAKLTYTAFIAKVIVDALRQFPMVNASIDGDNIVYKKDINLGIAVALENGLIVPVIRNADEKNLLGLSRAINDLGGSRAREEAESGRGAARHVHHHQPGDLRRALRSAADQPAAGGDPRRRRDREAGGRDRRCDRDPADVPPDARLRPPADRRRRRRAVPDVREGAAGEVRRGVAVIVRRRTRRVPAMAPRRPAYETPTGTVGSA